jgi:hypothetical protein
MADVALEVGRIAAIDKDEFAADARIDFDLDDFAIRGGEEPLPRGLRVQPGVEHTLGRKG